MCQLSMLAIAQFEQNFKPSPFLDTIPGTVAADLAEKLRVDKLSCTDPDRQVNTFLKSLYDKRHEYLVKSINDDLFIMDGDLASYVQSIANEIYAANPQLSRPVQVVVVRSETPNAMSFGEGTIGITLGLLSRLETDAQVAFVLCHEIAHFQAVHSDQHLRELARLNYDKDLKKKIDDVRRTTYNQYSRLKEIFKGMGFSITHHSRGYEFEADSLGLIYLRNTSFNPDAAIRVMEILDSVDVAANEKPVDFKRYFDFKKYPFKEHWVAYTKSDTWHASFKIEDSLKTHPDCDRRITALQRQGKRYAEKNGKDFISGNGIRHYRISSLFELVESLDHFKEYGRSLYAALQLTQQFPENTYLHAMIGRGLFKLYAAQKIHEFGKVTELPDPRFSESYDRYLTFIHKLRLGELAALSYHYITVAPEKDFEDEEMIYSLWLVSSLPGSEMDQQKVGDDYLSMFPDGRYKKDITNDKNLNNKNRK